MTAMPCTAVLRSKETKDRVSINYKKNSGPQRQTAALITTPNGKRPVHNYFTMQVNGKIINYFYMEDAQK